jgi:hypothetical protein
MGNTLIRSIAAYGERYRRDFLSHVDPVPLQTDWWRAFDFLLARICFQGRRDTVSLKVYHAAIDVLGTHFRGAECDETFVGLQNAGWEPLKAQLALRIGKGMVGKGRDREMIIGALDYVAKLPSKNIVAYSCNEIREGRLKRHYTSLLSIRQVGDKVASFYLRDLVSLCKLADFIDDQSASCLQPVDVWVRRIARQAGIAGQSDTDSAIRDGILKACRAEGVSPVVFNQGAWSMGYYAFDLLLERIAEAGAEPLMADGGASTGPAEPEAVPV